jgi:pimeloyl-ACP methyl ester carboxylesterase
LTGDWIRRASWARLPTWDDAGVSDHISVLGVEIAFERAGSGPSVALAHGFVGDGRSTWGAQIDALSNEYTVIAWDSPGAGGSSDPPEGFGMDDYADSFAGLLGALGIERAHLVGLSFGAALMLATFHRYHDLASSLALVSGYAGWRGSLGTEAADQRLARSLEVSRLPSEEFVAALVPSMFSPSADDERVAPFIDTVRETRRSGFRAMAAASLADQSHVLPQVDVPTLLLYADHDVRAPVAIGERMHELIRSSEFVVLAGPGHASPVEAPDDVTRELARVHPGARPGRPRWRRRTAGCRPARPSNPAALT